MRQTWHVQLSDCFALFFLCSVSKSGVCDLLFEGSEDSARDEYIGINCTLCNSNYYFCKLFSSDICGVEGVAYFIVKLLLTKSYSLCKCLKSAHLLLRKTLLLCALVAKNLSEAVAFWVCKPTTFRICMHLGVQRRVGLNFWLRCRKVSSIAT